MIGWFLGCCYKQTSFSHLRQPREKQLHSRSPLFSSPPFQIKPSRFSQCDPKAELSPPSAIRGCRRGGGVAPRPKGFSVLLLLENQHTRNPCTWKASWHARKGARPEASRLQPGPVLLPSGPTAGLRGRGSRGGGAPQARPCKQKASPRREGEAGALRARGQPRREAPCSAAGGEPPRSPGRQAVGGGGREEPPPPPRTPRRARPLPWLALSISLGPGPRRGYRQRRTAGAAPGRRRDVKRLSLPPPLPHTHFLFPGVTSASSAGARLFMRPPKGSPLGSSARTSGSRWTPLQP